MKNKINDKTKKYKSYLSLVSNSKVIDKENLDLMHKECATLQKNLGISEVAPYCDSYLRN